MYQAIGDNDAASKSKSSASKSKGKGKRKGAPDGDESSAKRTPPPAPRHWISWDDVRNLFTDDLDCGVDENERLLVGEAFHRDCQQECFCDEAVPDHLVEPLLAQLRETKQNIAKFTLVERRMRADTLCDGAFEKSRVALEFVVRGAHGRAMGLFDRIYFVQDTNTETQVSILEVPSRQFALVVGSDSAHPFLLAVTPETTMTFQNSDGSTGEEFPENAVQLSAEQIVDHMIALLPNVCGNDYH